MNSFCITLFVALFSSTLGLPTGEEKTSPIYRKQLHYTVSEDDFDPNNIRTSFSTDYDSQINITAISLTNDPNENLRLYYNVSENVVVAGLFNITLHRHKLDFQNPYKKGLFEISFNMLDSFVLNNGSISVNISLESFESLRRDVDFSNLQKGSRIEYNVSIIGVTNLTWFTDSNDNTNNNNDINVLLLDNRKPTLSNVYGDVPFNNATGHNDVSCQNTDCVTSTEHTQDTNQYVIDGVTVYNSRDISSWVDSEKYTDNTNTTYSVSTLININYVVLIGEHED